MINCLIVVSQLAGNGPGYEQAGFKSYLPVNQNQILFKGLSFDLALSARLLIPDVEQILLRRKPNTF
jgi:hypothetical protein